VGHNEFICLVPYTTADKIGNRFSFNGKKLCKAGNAVIAGGQRAAFSDQLGEGQRILFADVGNDYGAHGWRVRLGRVLLEAEMCVS